LRVSEGRRTVAACRFRTPARQSSSGLRKGDLGAVVEVYEPDGLEVEFVTASGKTEALLTLGVTDVRPVAENDLVAVRPYRRSA
jgi:uncharacterized protein DUF4926